MLHAKLQILHLLVLTFPTGLVVTSSLEHMKKVFLFSGGYKAVISASLPLSQTTS